MTAAFTPGGEALFFYVNHDIYWVSTEILRPYTSAAGGRGMTPAPAG